MSSKTHRIVKALIVIFRNKTDLNLDNEQITKLATWYATSSGISSLANPQIRTKLNKLDGMSRDSLVSHLNEASTVSGKPIPVHLT